MAFLRRQTQALLAAVALRGGALQGYGIRRHVQPAPLTVEQQGRTRRQQQHRRSRPHQRGDAQGPRNNRAVRRGPATGGDNPHDPRRIEARHIGRADFIHHQNIGPVRLDQRFAAAQPRQHTPTDVSQIRRLLGQQRIRQRLLLPGRRVDHRHPAGFGAFTLLEAIIDLVAQVRIVEHFLVSNENLANGLSLATLDQAIDIPADFAQGAVQTLAFKHG